jgi:hypothetical protein
MIGQQQLEAIARKLVDEGKLIAAGFLAVQVMHPGVTNTELERLRNAYFAGAQHLYASIMAIMDEDREVTERDLKRMEQIHEELTAWAKLMRFQPRRADS